MFILFLFQVFCAAMLLLIVQNCVNMITLQYITAIGWKCKWYVWGTVCCKDAGHKIQNRPEQGQRLTDPYSCLPCTVTWLTQSRTCFFSQSEGPFNCLVLLGVFHRTSHMYVPVICCMPIPQLICIRLYGDSSKYWPDWLGSICTKRNYGFQFTIA